MVRSSKPRRGFTLVELLVVIGIIAVLIGILLPVISRARRQANTTACMATLRSLGQALYIYAAENKGSLPYSYYTAAPPTGNAEAAGDTDATVYVWWSVLRSYMRRGGSPDNSVLNNDGSTSTRFMKAFMCAEGHDPDNGCDFGTNMVAMPELNWESHPFNASTSNPIIRPAKFTQLYPDNILMFDATELIDTSPPFARQYVCGYYVDGGSLAIPQQAYLRYRTMADARGQLGATSPLRNERPIDPGKNKDCQSALSGSGDGEKGNIRWRHGKEDAANFLFQDGTVRTLGMTRAYNPAIGTNNRGDVLHSMWRIKSPPGFQPRG